MKEKFVRDAIHGNIKMEGVFLKLLDHPAVQRLHGIKQLGFANLVYGGANHTRLEHSVGAFYVATRMAEAMGFSKECTKTAGAAALLHDVGHAPYSHTLEYVIHRRLGVDHMEITKQIILGKRNPTADADFEFDPIDEILEGEGIDPELVAELVTGGASSPYAMIEEFGSRVRRTRGKIKNPALGHIIHSAVDADQIDYLLRDAYYTGVAYGYIDMDRLLQTICMKKGMLCFDKKGLSALESIVVARGLMYSSVYFHKTARIAESMLCRAVGRMKEVFDFASMIDSELMEKLKTIGGYQKDIVLRLKYRRLFKQAFSVPLADLIEEERLRLADLDDPKILEDELARRAGVPEGYVMVDTPGKEILRTEPRLKSTDVRIVDEDRIRYMSEYTPIARAIQSRKVVDWGLMVSTPEEYRKNVARVAKKVIFG